MTYRLTKIYTRSGDDGKTNLGTKERLLKNAPRIEVLGTLDELNCQLGWMASLSELDKETHHALQHIQQRLFDMGGELCPPHQAVIQATDVQWLENKIDEWNETLPPLTEFLLPGGTQLMAACHIARAVCRRAERCLVTLHMLEPLRKELLAYVNRLSDWLFVLARVLGSKNQMKEVLWEHKKS